VEVVCIKSDNRKLPLQAFKICHRVVNARRGKLQTYLFCPWPDLSGQFHKHPVELLLLCTCGNLFTRPDLGLDGDLNDHVTLGPCLAAKEETLPLVFLAQLRSEPGIVIPFLDQYKALTASPLTSARGINMRPCHDRGLENSSFGIDLYGLVVWKKPYIELTHENRS